MKGLEKAAIVVASISLIFTVICKLLNSPLAGVQPTGMWRFTIACLGFAIWARLVQQGPRPTEETPEQTGD